MAHKTPRHRQQRRHLAQRKLDTAHDGADGGIAQQGARRPGRLDGTAQPQEQAGAYGARDGDQADVPLVQTPREVAGLVSRDQVAVQVIAVVELCGGGRGRDLH